MAVWFALPLYVVDSPCGGGGETKVDDACSRSRSRLGGKKIDDGGLTLLGLIAKSSLL